MDIEYLKRCSQLCTECCSETCVFNPQGICMAPFLTGKKPGIHDDGCTDYCPKPLDGCELVRSYSEHELRSYEEDVREYISQFTDATLFDLWLAVSLERRCALRIFRFSEFDNWMSQWLV